MTGIEALQPKSVGQPVNIHVVPARKEPQPDFEAMQRLIEARRDAAMTGIVERLRERATYDDLALLTEAADEIERLRRMLEAITLKELKLADEIERKAFDRLVNDSKGSQHG